eukprot:m51a1_g4602 putative U3 small nucleolar RNA-associated protein (506) ;mRNA; r:232038-233748
MAGDYRKIELVAQPKPSIDVEPESAFWSRYKDARHVALPAAVSCLDFSPVAPYDLAVTSSSRVSILDGRTCEPRHALTRFKAAALSGHYRSDGRLIIAGGEEGIVRVFDAATRSCLRLLRGHRGPVRAARFGRGKSIAVSGSDDGTFREWDISTSQNTLSLSAHTDHIRAVEGNPSSENVWATGSYDRTVRLWDARARSAVMTLDHGSPVEALVFFPAGNALVSAGGPYLRVWDIIGGGRLLAEPANHQKTITCLALDPTATRLVSGGADRIVKFYDVAAYRVVHTLAHHAPVLSVAMSPDGRRIAIGAADGDLCIRTRRDAATPQSAASDSAPLGTARYFLQSRGAAEEALVAESAKKPWLPEHEKLLRAFQYKMALDAALASKRADVVVSMLRELMHRGALAIALEGRDETSLEPLLVFLVNYCTVPRFARLLLTVALAVVEMYATVLGRSVAIDELFFKMQAALSREIGLQRDLTNILGALDLIVAAAEARPARDDEGEAQA